MMYRRRRPVMAEKFTGANTPLGLTFQAISIGEYKWGTIVAKPGQMIVDDNGWKCAMDEDKFNKLYVPIDMGVLDILREIAKEHGPGALKAHKALEEIFVFDISRAKEGFGVLVDGQFVEAVQYMLTQATEYPLWVEFPGGDVYRFTREGKSYNNNCSNLIMKSQCF